MSNAKSIKRINLTPPSHALVPLPDNTELSYRGAFDLTAPERAALASEDVLDTNVDLPNAVHIARQSVVRMQPLLPEIGKLPVRHELIARLEVRARAAIHAHVLYTASIAPPERLQAVYERALAGRQRVRSEVTNFINQGLVPANALDGMNNETGYRNVAYGTLYGVTTLRAHSAVIGTRGVLTPADLDEFELLANELETLNTRREQSRGADPKAVDEQNRAFTLMYESFEWARRAVWFVRWFHGDAREITPSLFTAPKTSKSKKEDQADAEGQGSASDDSPEPTPGDLVNTPNAEPDDVEARQSRVVPPGGRGSDPFGE